MNRFDFLDRSKRLARFYFSLGICHRSGEAVKSGSNHPQGGNVQPGEFFIYFFKL